MPEVIIGIGTGRNGTKSLSEILSSCKNVDVLHEGYITEWYRGSIWDDDPKIESLERQNNFFRQRMSEGQFAGNVAFFLLPRISFILENFKTAKIICLHRNKKDTVKSWMKWCHGLSHCFPPDMSKFVNSEHVKHQAKWFGMFPKFESAKNSEEAWEMYWDMYEEESMKLENVLHIQTESLNEDYKLDILYSFVEIPPEDRNYPEKRKFNSLD